MPTTQARPDKTPKPIRKAAAKKAAANGNGADHTAAPPDFWEALRSLKPGQFHAYVYRLWPKIDRRDEQHYLTKTSEPFDEDWLLRTFGSGKYSIKLNSAQQRTIASKTVSLHNADHAPKVNPLEVTSDPENDVYWRVWGKKAGAQDADQAAAPSVSGTDAGAAIRALEKLTARMADDSSALRTSERELMHDAARQAMELVKSQSAQGNGVDVGRILEVFAGLFERFEKSRQPANSGGDLAPVVAMMQEQAKQNNALMLELLRQREPAGGSKVSELGEMMAVMRELRQEFSDNPREPEEKPWYAHFAPAIGPALQLLAANQGGAAAGLPGISGPQPQPTAQPRQSTQDAPQGPPPPQQSDQPQQAAPPAQQSQQHPQQAQLDGFISLLAYPIIGHLTADEPDGGALADWLLAGYPEAVLVQAQQIGPDLLKAAIMGHAELWPQLAAHGADEARLSQFIGQFCSWTGEDEPAQPETK